MDLWIHSAVTIQWSQECTALFALLVQVWFSSIRAQGSNGVASGLKEQLVQDEKSRKTQNHMRKNKLLDSRAPLVAQPYLPLPTHSLPCLVPPICLRCRRRRVMPPPPSQLYSRPITRSAGEFTGSTMRPQRPVRGGGITTTSRLSSGSRRQGKRSRIMRRMRRKEGEGVLCD